MPSPFPGMDPYLEDPLIWSGVRFAILAVIQDLLSLPARAHRCFVDFALRTYTTDENDPAYPLHTARPPSRPNARVTQFDREIKDRWLEIRSLSPARLVTIIEVMTPEYKTADSYARTALLESHRTARAEGVNWLAIDLLRDGIRIAAHPSELTTEYGVTLERNGRAGRAYAWPIALRDRLPVVGVPLGDAIPDVPLDLQLVIDRAHLRGGYDLTTKYDADPPPPMSSVDLDWCRDRTREWRADGPHSD